MLVREGTSRTLAKDRHLAMSLAFVAGALNMAAFYAVGFFSANMTGNVSLLSDHAALGRWGGAALFLAVIVAFVGGSTSSALIINAGRQRGMSRIYAITILLEAACLLALGIFDITYDGIGKATIPIIALAWLMGLQNAIVTRISNARVRTTHVSGMLTDIGIGLALLIGTARDKDVGDGRLEVLDRLRLHSETVVAFLIGGVIGIVLHQEIGGYLLVLAASSLAMIALPAFTALRAR